VPYTEEDPVNPPGVYGRTKVEAERIVAALPRHWIVRVSVLFGPGKTNFVEKGLKRLQAGEPYRVAADQVACATYTLDAAQAMMHLVENDATGTFHVTNRGPCSREELAVRAAEIAGLDKSLVQGLPAQSMKRPGPRVLYAVLSTEKIERLGMKLRPWQEALEEYVRTCCVSPQSTI
jgi:dTDP-4-dehydrorhamnose reductase